MPDEWMKKAMEDIWQLPQHYESWVERGAMIIERHYRAELRTLSMECLNIAEDIIREVFPIGTWACEQDRLSQWAKRKDRIAGIVARYARATTKAETSVDRAQFQLDHSPYETDIPAGHSPAPAVTSDHLRDARKEITKIGNNCVEE